MQVKQCETCKKEFETNNRLARFCSVSCKNKALITQVTLTCAVCSEQFNVPKCRAKSAKCCSKQCLTEYQTNRPVPKLVGKNVREKAVKVCLTCRKEFLVNKTNTLLMKRKFCSNVCQREHILVNGLSSMHKHFVSGWIYVERLNKSMLYRSSYERNCILMFSSSDGILDFQHEPFYVNYISSEGKLRRYYPDFIVEYVDGTKEVIEVKPSKFINDENVQLKIKAIQQYCLEHNYKFSIWTEKTHKFLLSKRCNDYVVGSDANSYGNNPTKGLRYSLTSMAT